MGGEDADMGFGESAFAGEEKRAEAAVTEEAAEVGGGEMGFVYEGFEPLERGGFGEGERVVDVLVVFDEAVEDIEVIGLSRGESICAFDGELESESGGGLEFAFVANDAEGVLLDEVEVVVAFGDCGAF